MTVKIKDIACTITFPASAKDKFKHKYDPETAAHTAVTDAVAHFELPNDGTTRYYLYYNGAEVAASATLASLLPTEDGHGPGHDDEGRPKLELGLRTETVSG
jgi:hypothetical protein